MVTYWRVLAEVRYRFHLQFGPLSTAPLLADIIAWYPLVFWMKSFWDCILLCTVGGKYSVWKIGRPEPTDFVEESHPSDVNSGLGRCEVLAVMLVQVPVVWNVVPRVSVRRHWRYGEVYAFSFRVFQEDVEKLVITICTNCCDISSAFCIEFI